MHALLPPVVKQETESLSESLPADHQDYKQTSPMIQQSDLHQSGPYCLFHLPGFVQDGTLLISVEGSTLVLSVEDGTFPVSVEGGSPVQFIVNNCMTKPLSWYLQLTQRDQKTLANYISLSVPSVINSTPPSGTGFSFQTPQWCNQKQEPSYSELSCIRKAHAALCQGNIQQRPCIQRHAPPPL